MISQPASHPAPEVAEVEHIAGLGDGVVRNLRITQCYAELSAAVAARVGDAANWCTFATWASKQAGCAIRGEDLLNQLERQVRLPLEFSHPVRSLWRVLLRRGLFRPETRLGKAVREIHSPFDAFERTSEAVARGNLKVFAEIGRIFALYLRDCPAGAPVESEPCRRFLDSLRPAGPPDGQAYLRSAFSRYQQAQSEGDARSRAQLVLLANAEIGLHEQTRLQPEIHEAMDAGPATAEDLGERALNILCPGWRSWWAVFRTPLHLALSRLAAAFRNFSYRLTRAVITDRLMVLGLPGGRTLELGRHLDDPFPQSLRSLDHPELTALAARFEPPANEPDRCGAEDWSDLKQRMHYILHLFRAFQESPELREPPFTTDQVRRIKEGRLPDGRL